MAAANGGGVPKVQEATVEDLERLVSGFAEAAFRARQAGFDAVEIHGAHGYIFSEFLSPAWNLREDQYGGPVENRARLLCDVIRAAKARAGADFPIWCRIDALEFGVADGIQTSDAGVTAQLAEAAGADAIHVSAYANPLGAGFTEAPIVHREGGFVKMAAEIKRRVQVPVIVAGRISPERGDEVIAKGEADLIAMGRQLLADPETVNKLVAGKREQVRPCVSCYVCVARPFFDQKVKCSVNPVTAEEEKYADLLRTKAAVPKNVLVVGGGPAGLEAAATAAGRGHHVRLVEKSLQLGGTLRDALSGAARGSEGPRLSVAGRLAMVAGRVTGISDSPAKLRKASKLYMRLGQRVTLIGGGLVGLELAEFFAERGRVVTVLEEGPIMGVEMAHPRRWRVLFDLREAGVRLETNVTLNRITASTVQFSVRGSKGNDSEANEIPADSVVIATGLAANPDAVSRLETDGVPTVVIGDAGGVGYIEGAIHDGFRAGIEL